MPNRTDLIVFDFDGTIIKGNLNDKINKTLLFPEGITTLEDSINLLKQDNKIAEQWMDEKIII